MDAVLEDALQLSDLSWLRAGDIGHVRIPFDAQLRDDVADSADAPR
jgi:hypothetical protein